MSAERGDVIDVGPAGIEAQNRQAIRCEGPLSNPGANDADVGEAGLVVAHLLRESIEYVRVVHVLPRRRGRLVAGAEQESA